MCNQPYGRINYPYTYDDYAKVTAACGCVGIGDDCCNPTTAHSPSIGGQPCGLTSNTMKCFKCRGK